MPDITGLDVPIGSGWRHKRTGMVLQVLDHDISYSGDVLLSVSIEGGSRQLLEPSLLLSSWLRLDG